MIGAAGAGIAVKFGDEPAPAAPEVAEAPWVEPSRPVGTGESLRIRR
jgi:hypothetical protein